MMKRKDIVQRLENGIFIVLSAILGMSLVPSVGSRFWFELRVYDSNMLCCF
jgi:hypothetical protein